MTVDELIHQLKDLPGDMHLCAMHDGEAAHREVVGVSTAESFGLAIIELREMDEERGGFLEELNGTEYSPLKRARLLLNQSERQMAAEMGIAYDVYLRLEDGSQPFGPVRQNLLLAAMIKILMVELDLEA